MESRVDARLKRLRLLNEADLAALPYGHDLAPTMTDHEPAEGGGISLADTEEAPSAAAGVLEQISRYVVQAHIGHLGGLTNTFV